MPTYTSTVSIVCETEEQANQVLAERLAHDEDYGFPYIVTENGAKLAKVTLYAVGDPDPTPNDGIWCPAYQGAAPESCGFGCTWASGHAHPQHVAGDGELVCAVWDVSA